MFLTDPLSTHGEPSDRKIEKKGDVEIRRLWINSCAAKPPSHFECLENGLPNRFVRSTEYRLPFLTSS
ncbi:MAG: hypothetical protein ACRC2T_14505 [Thermoguttaceae bacterium]